MTSRAAFSSIAVVSLSVYLAACSGGIGANRSGNTAPVGGSRGNAVGDRRTGGRTVAPDSRTSNTDSARASGAIGRGGGAVNSEASATGGASAGGSSFMAGGALATASNESDAVGGAMVGTAGSGNPVGSPAAGGGRGNTVAGKSNAEGAGAKPGYAGANNGGKTGDDAFEACIRLLKPKCAYDEYEAACSSLMTAQIPLSDGKTWGNTELKQGPYGSYVEWNEGSAYANPENLLEATCGLAAASFGEPQSVTDDVLDLRGQDLKLYTVFRPACMKKGEKYPVITWGNGTCGQAGGYGSLLATVASHGFVIVAANSRWTDQGNDEMLKALDFAKAANEDPNHSLYQQLDLSKVGAMGHSQGGSATAHAASDARIKAVILWNGGTSASKPFLAVSGDRDIGGNTPEAMASAVNGAAQPGAWLFYHQVLETGGDMTGHLTLMEQPERVAGPAIAWWKYMLSGEAEARMTFVGTDCGLCNHKDEYEFGQHGLP